MGRERGHSPLGGTREGPAPGWLPGSTDLRGQAGVERTPGSRPPPVCMPQKRTLKVSPPYKLNWPLQELFFIQASWQGKEPNLTDKRGHGWAPGGEGGSCPLLSPSLVQMPGSFYHGIQWISGYILQNSRWESISCATSCSTEDAVAIIIAIIALPPLGLWST